MTIRDRLIEAGAERVHQLFSRMLQRFQPPADMSINEKVAFKEGVHWAFDFLIEHFDASESVDAMLGVLENHADEWIREERLRQLKIWGVDDESAIDPVTDSYTIGALLAVLKGETE